MPQLYEFDTIEDNLKLAKELGVDFIAENAFYVNTRFKRSPGRTSVRNKAYKTRDGDHNQISPVNKCITVRHGTENAPEEMGD